MNPCIIVDNYNVFIIGGQTKNGTYLSTTWRAAFNVIPDQVNNNCYYLFSTLKFSQWARKFKSVQAKKIREIK